MSSGPARAGSANARSSAPSQLQVASHPMSRLVIRVSPRQTRVVLASGLITGAAIFAAGPRPTGTLLIDAFLVTLAATFIVWCGATAPWWSLMVLSGASSLLVIPHLTVAAGVAVFLVAIWVGTRQEPQIIERAIVVGASLVIIAMAGSVAFFGFTSLTAVALSAFVAVPGILRRPNSERRIAAWMAAGSVAYCLIAVTFMALTVLSVRGDLRGGNQAAREGLDLLTQGEFDSAQSSFAEAARQFGKADDGLAKPWAQFARLVPIANQYRRAADELAGAAATATRVTDVELRKIDIDDFRLVEGRIDLDAVRALHEPMQNLQRAMAILDYSIGKSRSPWLVSQLQVRLDELSIDIRREIDHGTKALKAIELAPAMLGADGERVYFVMFTTPAEARGQGGFMGNYAELTVDDGHIRMTAFGRHSDLSDQAADDIVISGPQDWLESYGKFGFQVGPDKTFDPRAWANITISPDFPSTAQVVAELYPQSGGRRVDGVINLDVFALETLIRFVGPLAVVGAPEPLTGSNTADFLLRGQYLVEGQSERVNMLQEVAEMSMTALLSKSPPDPIDLGREFSPLVSQRRAMMWARDPGEQEMLALVGLDASLPTNLNGADALAVTVNNASANKIDAYLERQFRYRVEVDPAGDIHASLTLSFSNTAPASGLPDYVISNALGVAKGTSRLLVTIFTPYDLVTGSIDGRDQGYEPGTEAGLRTYSQFIDIPAGSTVTVTYQLTGRLGDGPYHLTLLPQPLANPETWSLELPNASQVD